MQGDLSLMRRTPVLEQINPLPSPQSELALQDRNRELHAGQDRTDVGGHVIGAFVRVPIVTILRRHAVEKCLKIGPNVPRGVFLYDQSGRGMPAKQGQKPGLDAMWLEPIQDFAVISTSPRPRVETETRPTNWRISRLAAAAGLVALGTLR